jgi:AraC family transcriptional regulator of adaptative response / methylphosphotriester-DNA alkyltransferase methyltransferase
MVRNATLEFRRSLYEHAAVLIEREYASDLRLDDVARRLLTSPRQLQRAFDEVGGTSFRDYVCLVRMRRAAAALRRRPDLTVSQIALAVGYHQRAQFAKAFRRHYGVAPSEYRHGVVGRTSASPRGVAALHSAPRASMAERRGGQPIR